jgi:hypothetical protein
LTIVNEGEDGRMETRVGWRRFKAKSKIEAEEPEARWQRNAMIAHNPGFT